MGRNQILPGFEDDRLYQFAQKVYPGCDIGLITYHGMGSNACIAPHRDDRYAQPIARLVNLGNCTFGYCNSRIGNKLDRYQLVDGGIYEFNCKHVHSVLSCSQNRFSIVLWKLRPEFY
ncbi:MAG: hypothetical protein D6728_07480 [Cyanobacteria bacterium J055]|nr:MAG: hypothetical protein D6728_07480 [Cyanobacteria bacterium J055]